MPKETKQEAFKTLLDMIVFALCLAAAVVVVAAWVGPEKAFPSLYLDSEVGSSEKHKQ